MKYKNTVKFFLLFVFLGLGFYLFKFTSLGQYASKDALQSFILGFGALGPVVFIVLFTFGTLLFVPGGVFIALGAVLFGPWLGFLYNYLAHVVGSIVGFYVAKFLGRSFVANLGYERLQKYNRKLGEHGFSTVLYLRLIFSPFSIINVAAGLSSISFGAYFWGTILGIIPTVFVLTLFIDSLTSIQGMSDLLHWEFLLIVLLVVLLFMTPRFLKKLPTNIKRRLHLSV